MWDDIFKRWLDLIFWWVPRTEETRPESARESSPVASEQGASRVPEEAVEQQVPKAEKVVPDDLTVIKGIGPVVQRKLRSLGTSAPSACGLLLGTISLPSRATMRVRPPRRRKGIGMRMTSVVPSNLVSARGAGGERLRLGRGDAPPFRVARAATHLRGR
jgi:hypothetical protein